VSAPFLGPDAAPHLVRSLCSGLSARDVRVLRTERLSGGAVQENWALDVHVEGGEHHGQRALVLRTDAPGSLAASLQRGEEFQVLQTVWQAGVRVPRPLYLEEDGGALGRPFYVMTREAGVASAHRVVKMELDAESLVTCLGRELGTLHRVVPPWPGLEALEVPDLPAAEYRVHTYRCYLDDLSSPQPTLEWALRWLQRNAPRDATLTLCHGDFRTGNYLVHEGVPAAILDWEFAAWSHPYEDIGWFCARCWRFGRDHLPAGGMGSREAFYAGYAETSGHEVDPAAIGYWEIMATVRWAVIALQQGERFLGGNERSLEAALTARMVPDMELDLLDQIEAHQRGDRRC
jgi:aminoglycoside phosphotransferase (APT) family kinase protein